MDSQVKIQEYHLEIYRAVFELAECVKNIKRLEVAWLLPQNRYGRQIASTLDYCLTPTYSFECMLLPCVLHFINPKQLLKSLGHQTHSRQSLESAVEQSFFDTLKSFQPQLGCHGYIRELIEHISDVLEIGTTTETKGPSGSDVLAPRTGGPIVDWIDMLATQPERYLRVIAALDQFLNLGQVPDHSQDECVVRNFHAESDTLNGHAHRSFSKTESGVIITQAITPPLSHYSPCADPGTILTDHGNGAEATLMDSPKVNDEMLDSLFNETNADMDWHPGGDMDFDAQLVTDLIFEGDCM